MAVLIILVGTGLYRAGLWPWSEPQPEPIITYPVALKDIPLPGPTPGTPRIPMLNNATVHSELGEFYVYQVVREAAEQWGAYFTESGIRVQQPSIVSVSNYAGPVSWGTACRRDKQITPGYKPVFYCSDDQTIWLPQQTIGQVRALGPEVNFPVAFVAAMPGLYAYGIYVIDQLWATHTLPRMSYVNHDLLASCFAGIWAGVNYPDLPAPVREAAVVVLEGYSPPELLQWHSREDRHGAFNTGFSLRRPLACVGKYWDMGGVTVSASPVPSPSESARALKKIP